MSVIFFVACRALSWDHPARLDLPEASGSGVMNLKELMRSRGRQHLQYSDLHGIPCLLVLCEKGRMGDTFPETFACLDLRIRTSDNATTFVQELGRLCRYPSAPAPGHPDARVKATSDQLHELPGHPNLVELCKYLRRDQQQDRRMDIEEHISDFQWELFQSVCSLNFPGDFRSSLAGPLIMRSLAF